MSKNEDRQETDPRMASSTDDPPIRRKKEDRLNRARFAEALAGQDLFESLSDRAALAAMFDALDPRMLEHAVERPGSTKRTTDRSTSNQQ